MFLILSYNKFSLYGPAPEVQVVSGGDHHERYGSNIDYVT